VPIRLRQPLRLIVGTRIRLAADQLIPECNSTTSKPQATIWDATLGELYRRSGNRERARVHLPRALDAAPTHAEKALLRRRLDACGIPS
jgi:predicted RNA polymerase sigma factor